jgi:prevent-host-death family protein
MSEVSVARAKAEFAALVSRAEAGEQIVVTRNGKRVACLGPLPEKQPVVYGDLAHLAPSFASLELEDLSIPEEVIEDFERSAAEFKWP